MAMPLSIVTVGWLLFCAVCYHTTHNPLWTMLAGLAFGHTLAMIWLGK